MLFRWPGKRLYAITPDLADTDLLLDQCSAALSAGIGALQYRNKTASAELRRMQARDLNALCLDFGTPLIINDDWQLAREIGAAGAHLGRDDGSLVAGRRAFDGVLGVSCYDQLDAALEAEQAGADYVAFGSFFKSDVKPDAIEAKLDLLEQAQQRLSIPVIAIGGITLANAARVRAAGADAIAVISGVFAHGDIGAAVMAFNKLLD